MVERVKRDKWYLIVIVLLLALLIYSITHWMPKAKSIPRIPFTAYDADSEKYQWEVTEIAKDLEVPWDLALSDDEDLFITERPGRVKVLEKNNTLTTIATLSQVASVGESGLTGLALHPDFSANGYIYLYYTYRFSGNLYNRVSKFTYKDNKLSSEQVIIDLLPGGSIHNGGRLKFGPDKKLWVLTGDGARPSLSQDLDSLGGKVLRVNEDGSIPDDNPIKGSPVYSYGHRNPQGLDWHPLTEELLVTEHGESAYDEVNLIKPNSNYGWPEVKRCFSSDPKFVNPILCSENSTWAPSGAAFFGHSYFFAGLRGNILQRVEIINGKATLQETIIDGRYGRLRAVISNRKDALFVSTSNKDGRGNVTAGDDKILKVTPKKMQ